MKVLIGSTDTVDTLLFAVFKRFYSPYCNHSILEGDIKVTAAVPKTSACLYFLHFIHSIKVRNKSGVILYLFANRSMKI